MNVDVKLTRLGMLLLIQTHACLGMLGRHCMWLMPLRIERVVQGERYCLKRLRRLK